MQFTLSALTTLAFVAGSMAHLKMKEPLQWGMESPFASSPLAGDGSDFPCQNFYDIDAKAKTASKTYIRGGSGNLEVIGGATHGGGSGQMVITYDLPPTKDSVWKVMQSWEGDHPVKADGNTSGNSEEDHKNPIPFAIPKGIPKGTAVVAWTWFNRIGNREWYMKCSTVNIADSEEEVEKKSAAEQTTEYSAFNSLPDMFRANIPALSGSCRIPEGVSVIDFGSSAGANVVVAPGAQPEVIEGCDTGSSGSTPTQPETPSQPEAPAATSTYVEQPAGPTSAPEGDDNSESGSSDSEELPSQPTEPVASPSAAPSPIAQPDNSNKETDTGSSGSCVEGTTACSDGNTWSQCGSGRMQNMGLVPAGLACSDGKLIAKRAVRFSAEHRRHRSRHV